MKNEKTVPLYDKQGNVIGYVSKAITSIGASKALKSKNAEYTLRYGKGGWVAKN